MHNLEINIPSSQIIILCQRFSSGIAMYVHNCSDFLYKIIVSQALELNDEQVYLRKRFDEMVI